MSRDAAAVPISLCTKITALKYLIVAVVLILPLLLFLCHGGPRVLVVLIVIVVDWWWSPLWSKPQKREKWTSIFPWKLITFLHIKQFPTQLPVVDRDWCFSPSPVTSSSSSNFWSSSSHTLVAP